MIQKISVTADDIGNGEPGEPCACPVALAIRRALGGRCVFVGTVDADLGDREIRRVDLPQAAADFIARVDVALPVEPFEFEITVPDEYAPAVTE